MSSYTPGDVEYLHSDRPELAALVPLQCRTVLDVGCATGQLGERLMRERPGLKVDGIEPNPSAARAAADKLVHVITGAFPHADLRPAAYDCVIFGDVLEHMVDPWSALTEARGLLTDNGWIVASLPNIRHIEVLFDLVVRGRFRYSDYGILDRTHLRFFTKSSVVDLFESCGYQIEEIRHYEGGSGRRVSRLARTLGHRGGVLRTVQFGVLARVGSEK